MQCSVVREYRNESAKSHYIATSLPQRRLSQYRDTSLPCPTQPTLTGLASDASDTYGTGARKLAFSAVVLKPVLERLVPGDGHDSADTTKTSCWIRDRNFLLI